MLYPCLSLTQLLCPLLYSLLYVYTLAGSSHFYTNSSGYIHFYTSSSGYIMLYLLANVCMSILKLYISSTESTPSLTTSPSFHVMAGDNVTLTCSVTLLTGAGGFRWEGPGVTPTPASPIISGQMVSSGLILSEIATSQAGQYTCTTASNSTSVNISVQSKYNACTYQ